MLRKEVTPQHLEEILEIFAVACFGTERAKELRRGEKEYPFIWGLFWIQPEDLVDIFHNGSLMHDLQRVGGIDWSWNVSTIQDHLRIHFYKNKPTREKTEEERQQENELNRRVAEYLDSNTR